MPQALIGKHFPHKNPEPFDWQTELVEINTRTTTVSTGASRGCTVWPPPVHIADCYKSLLESNCRVFWWHIVQLISKNNESVYRQEVEQLVDWDRKSNSASLCGQNKRNYCCPRDDSQRSLFTAHQWRHRKDTDVHRHLHHGCWLAC